MIGLAFLLGGGALLLFAAFLYAGSLKLADLGLSHAGALLADTGLSLLFFLQHSGMVRKPFRSWLTRHLPEEYDRAVYAIVSGLVLLLLVVFWQEGAPLFTAAGFFRWFLRALFCLSVLGFLWGGLALKGFDPLGINPILDRLRGRESEPVPFTVKGPYRLVRHPLYLFSILLIWSSPDLSTDRLLFNLLWTGWIVAGAFLEERDLVAEFGDAYREYQRRVPMLIPLRFRSKGD